MSGKRVCIVGGGSAGVSCAWALSVSNTARVEIIEAEPCLGGSATTERVGEKKVKINDGVQGGATSYRNILKIMHRCGCEPPTYLNVRVSFGKGETNWTNHTVKPIVRAHEKEIERFGTLLEKISKYEAWYAFQSIEYVLKSNKFSTSFAKRIVFPLVALFFGTGNQTPKVPAAVFARVFNDPKLRLYDYDPKRFLSATPKMFAFPLFREMYEAIARAISKAGAQVTLNTEVTKVERRRGFVRVYAQTKGGVSFTRDYDAIVFACNTEVSERILRKGTGTTWRERWVFSNIEYFDDVSVTHTDDAYMRKHYDLSSFDEDEEETDAKTASTKDDDTEITKAVVATKDDVNKGTDNGLRGDMYFVKTYEDEPEKIEMSFDLTAYQPKAASSGRRRIFQSIFLNAKERAKWTRDEIDTDKILLTKWWRQFAHTVNHFTRSVPFWRFVQGRERTYYAGSYTFVNTHEIACISGLAAAYRIGAPYPFGDDELAALQFDTYLSLIHGAKRSEA